MGRCLRVLAPSTHPQLLSAPRTAANAEMWIPARPNFSNFSRQAVYLNLLKWKFPVFATWQLISTFKEETPYDPNKHICRANWMGLACGSQSATSGSVPYAMRPASFKNYSWAWTDSYAYLCEVSKACGLCERHTGKPFIFEGIWKRSHKGGFPGIIYEASGDTLGKLVYGCPATELPKTTVWKYSWMQKSSQSP